MRRTSAPKTGLGLASLVCSLLASVALFAASPALASASEANVKITGGKWDSEVEVVEAGHSTVYSDVVEWGESFDGSYWSLEGWKDTVSQSGYAPEARKPDCSQAMRLVPNSASAIEESEREGYGGGWLADQIVQVEELHDDWQVSLYAPALGSAADGGLEEGAAGEGTCSTSSIDVGWTPIEGNIWPMGISAEYEPTHGPQCETGGGDGDRWELEFPASGTHTTVEDCSAEGTAQEGEASYVRKVVYDQTVTLSASGASSGGGSSKGSGGGGATAKKGSTAKGKTGSGKGHAKKHKKKRKKTKRHRAAAHGKAKKKRSKAKKKRKKA